MAVPNKKAFRKQIHSGGTYSSGELKNLTLDDGTRHLTTMVGITEVFALYVLGEIGADRSVWRDSASLASWAGLSPAKRK